VNRPEPIRPSSLHERIRAELEGLIASGEWKPGTRVPSEHQLMETYDCSRMTVNKALSALAAAGLVQRRTRAGTFVAARHFVRGQIEFHDIGSQIAAMGKAYHIELLNREVRKATAEDREKLSCAKGGSVLELDCIHFADAKPYAVEHRLINLAEAPEALDADFSQQSPGIWLIEHASWTIGDHQISAVNATDEMASVLGIPNGSACLSLERRTWRSNEKISYAKQIFPGDQYVVVARVIL
jgi:GntR family histidine utilization transcriptional repressor